MKSQDIGLLFKLISLHKQEAGPAVDNINKSWPMDWQDWDSELDDEHLGAKSSQTAPSEYLASRYTARSLEESLGISKSQINSRAIVLSRQNQQSWMRKSAKSKS